VDAVLPMAELRQGLERMERNDSVGKLVVRWE
jgi:NADPH2:quinone reductase